MKSKCTRSVAAAQKATCCLHGLQGLLRKKMVTQATVQDCFLLLVSSISNVKSAALNLSTRNRPHAEAGVRQPPCCNPASLSCSSWSARQSAASTMSRDVEKYPGSLLSCKLPFFNMLLDHSSSLQCRGTRLSITNQHMQHFHDLRLDDLSN